MDLKGQRLCEAGKGNQIHSNCPDGLSCSRNAMQPWSSTTRIVVTPSLQAIPPPIVVVSQFPLSSNNYTPSCCCFPGPLSSNNNNPPIVVVPHSLQAITPSPLLDCCCSPHPSDQTRTNPPIVARAVAVGVLDRKHHAAAARGVECVAAVNVIVVFCSVCHLAVFCCRGFRNGGQNIQEHRAAVVVAAAAPTQP